MRPVARATLHVGKPSRAALDLTIMVVLRPIQHRVDEAAGQAHGQDALAGRNEEAHPPGIKCPCDRTRQHAWPCASSAFVIQSMAGSVCGEGSCCGGVTNRCMVPRVHRGRAEGSVARFPLFSCDS